MSEVWQGTQVAVGILIVTTTAWFCMLGGRSISELQKWHLAIFGDRSNRIYGRLIAPLFFATCNILLALTAHLSWLHFLGYATYMAAFTMGYGGDTVFEKIWRRALWSIVWTAACLPYVFASANPAVWTIFITQVLVGLIVAVIWGVTNPTLAPREEYVIKFFNLAFVPFMVL